MDSNCLLVGHRGTAFGEMLKLRDEKSLSRETTRYLPGFLRSTSGKKELVVMTCASSVANTPHRLEEYKG